MRSIGLFYAFAWKGLREQADHWAPPPRDDRDKTEPMISAGAAYKRVSEKIVHSHKVQLASLGDVLATRIQVLTALSSRLNQEWTELVGR